MRLVILESPYAGDVEANVAYARACMADCLRRGEAPIASHLLYTQPGILDDDVPAERKLGIAAGLAWGRAAEAAVFYIDRGWSPGMIAALERHRNAGLETEQRCLRAPALSLTNVLTTPCFTPPAQNSGSALGNRSESEQ